MNLKPKHGLLYYPVDFGRQSRPKPFMSLALGEAEGIKGLQRGIRAFKRSWSGEHHPIHVAFPADIDIEAPKTDGFFMGIFGTGIVVGPHGCTEISR